MKLNDGLTDAEKLYKSLYLQFPQVWEEPTQDWEALVRRYHRLGIRQIPPQPPSVMGTVMTEEDFFYGRAKKWSALTICAIVPLFCISWSLSRSFMYGGAV